MIYQLKQEESEEKLAQEPARQEKHVPIGEVVQSTQQGHHNGQDEKFKAEELAEREGEQQGSFHNKQVLCVTEIEYDNSQSVSETQIDALIKYVEKKNLC
jgi:hypothetical protein